MVGVGKITEEEVKYFANTMCKACSFCGDDLTMPFFCLRVYKEDKKRFLKIIKHLNAEITRGKNKHREYSTFLGFCGLFCNTDSCPARSKACSLIVARIHCYGMFVSQWAPGTLTTEIKKQITDRFDKSELELDQLGAQFSATNDPFVGLKKGKKRAIKKSISKAHKMFAAASKSKDFRVINKSSNNNVSKKVKATTTIFYNDDDEAWQKELKVILGGL